MRHSNTRIFVVLLGVLACSLCCYAQPSAEPPSPYSGLPAPTHYAFTRPVNKTLWMLVALMNFADAGAQNQGYLTNPVETQKILKTMNATRQYFSDMTYGMLDVHYSYTPLLNTTLKAADYPTAGPINGDIKTAAIELSKTVNMHYCGGPCGTVKASTEYKPANFSQVPGYFDSMIVVFRDSPPAVNYAGLGVVGEGFTWVPYDSGMDEAVVEHEVGHNFGIGHGQTNKGNRLGENYNTPQYNGRSRMAAGGSVYYLDEASRYNTNGQFGGAEQHWYGWFEDQHVIFMWPHGPTPDCPHCKSVWHGKLNAFDRPDVIPGSPNTLTRSGSPYFLATVWYDQNSVLYVYYRSSYPGTKPGISVEWCNRDFTSSDSGAYMTCDEYDVQGDTFTLEDQTVLPNTTYVALPYYRAITKDSQRTLMHKKLAVQVISCPDYAPCTNMFCPPDYDISCEIKLWFVAENTTLPESYVTTPDKSLKEKISGSSLAGKRVIAAKDPVSRGAEGVGMEGEFKISLCPKNMETRLYYHDFYPYSSEIYKSPPGYGAINGWPVKPIDCCTGTQPSKGVKMVKVTNLDPSQRIYLHEVEIFLAGDDTTNVAPKFTCYSLPAGGSFYTGDTNTGLDARANDLEYTGSVVSVAPQGGVLSHIACTIEEPVQVNRVALWPMTTAWCDRSMNFSIEVFEEFQFVNGEKGPKGAGFLYRNDIITPGEPYYFKCWPDKHKNVTNIAANLPATFECPSKNDGWYNVTMKSMLGEGYWILEDVQKGAGSEVSVLTSYKNVECATSAAKAMVEGRIACLCKSYYADGRYWSFSGTPSAWTYGFEGTSMKWMPFLNGTSAVMGGAPETRLPKYFKVEQMNSDVLNLCEFRAWDQHGVDQMKYATCYNLPYNNGQYYTAKGTGNGTQVTLTDGDTSTCAHSGSTGPIGNEFVCVFAEPVKLLSYQIVPNPSWRSRSTNLKVTMWADGHVIGADGHSNFTALLYSSGVKSFYDGDTFTVDFCEYAPVSPKSSISDLIQDGVDRFGTECAETRTFPELFAAFGQGSMEFGGFGSTSMEHSWVCLKAHTCLSSLSAAQFPGLTPASDYICYIVDENTEELHAWKISSDFGMDKACPAKF